MWQDMAHKCQIRQGRSLRHIAPHLPRLHRESSPRNHDNQMGLGCKRGCHHHCTEPNRLWMTHLLPVVEVAKPWSENVNHLNGTYKACNSHQQIGVKSFSTHICILSVSLPLDDVQIVQALHNRSRRNPAQSSCYDQCHLV